MYTYIENLKKKRNVRIFNEFHVSSSLYYKGTQERREVSGQVLLDTLVG